MGQGGAIRAGCLAHRRTGAQAASSKLLFQFRLPDFKIVKRNILD
jgi:hypothetical protein